MYNRRQFLLTFNFELDLISISACQDDRMIPAKNVHPGCPIVQKVIKLQLIIMASMKSCSYKDLIIMNIWINEKKYESSRDLQLKFEILPATWFLKYKRTCQRWKIFSGHLPAFRRIKYQTFEVTRNKQTNSYFCKLIPKTKYMQNCFFNTTVPLYNSTLKIFNDEKNISTWCKKNISKRNFLMIFARRAKWQK